MAGSAQLYFAGAEAAAAAVRADGMELKGRPIGVREVGTRGRLRYDTFKVFFFSRVLVQQDVYICIYSIYTHQRVLEI